MSATEVMGRIKNAFGVWQEREQGYWTQLTSAKDQLSHKQVMLLLFSNLALQHAYASLNLASQAQLGPARALVRPAIEAHGRCIYIGEVAPDDWSEQAFAILKEMQALADAGDANGAIALENKIKLPFGQRLCDSIAGKAQGFDELVVRTFEKIGSALNSYTHGGILQTGRLFNISGIGEPSISLEHCRHLISMITLASQQITYIAVKFDREDVAVDVRKSLVELFSEFSSGALN